MCVRFQDPRPADLDRLASFFGTRDLSFGHEDTALALESSDLDRTMPHADASGVESIAPLVDAELGATAYVQPRVQTLTGKPPGQWRRDYVLGFSSAPLAMTVQSSCP